MAKKSLDERIEGAKNFLKENLNTVRAGRANPALLDKIMVNYYGTPTPLKALANISVPDPRTLMISPFDPKSVGDIERSILEANIGINPTNDGKVIRLAIPQLTEERRKELTKVVKNYGEDAKVAVRNLRRDVNDELKKAQKVCLYATRQTIFSKLVGMVDDIKRPIFQGDPTGQAIGYILGGKIKEEDGVPEGKILIGNPKQFLYNMVQDVMVETDRDIKKHVTTYSGYARGEGALMHPRSFVLMDATSAGNNDGGSGN